jgi:leucyl aminopeptidase
MPNSPSHRRVAVRVAELAQLADDLPAVTVDAGTAGAAAAAEGGESALCIGVPVFQGAVGPVVAEGVPAMLTIGGASVPATLDDGVAAARRFTGKVGETLVLPGLGHDGGGGPVDLVFVGCGQPSEVSTDTQRRMTAALVRAASGDATAVVVVPPALVGDEGARAAGRALAEGAILADYRYTAHKTAPEPAPLRAVFLAAGGPDPGELEEGTREGTLVADAVCFARDLVNEPPSAMSPSILAGAVAEFLAGRPGVRFEAWDEDRIVEERLGGLLGVARGSAEPPRLLWASYQPSRADAPHVVLVGKGITFDSGGLSLKTADGMVTMKTDMSGAAAVMAAVGACASLALPVRVTAIAPATENMPGGRATKPGDVLTIRNGLTIEVLNTDAEGRLVLADGLSLAAELQPDVVIDIATLTGACVVALGRSIAGLFGTDDTLLEIVKSAAERAGEPVWPLPIPERYRSHIDSEVADMKNMGSPGQAGAIAAATLLSRFVEGTPWAHLDIAGPARSEEADGPVTKGGTGFGVRTLVEVVASYAGNPGS